MIGLPRFSPTILTLIGVLVAGLALPLSAQETTQPATAPTVGSDVKDAVENYWHYGKVARYDLAVVEGQKVISAGSDAETVLRAFEQVAAEHKDSLDQWLLRWQGVEAMKDINSQITKLISEGYRARRSSPEFITAQIDRLSTNERAYELAVTRLRESGELAVPIMLDILRNPSKKNMQPVIRRALRDLGRYAVNPLCAATEMKDWDTLTTIEGTLGDLGYPAAAPYLTRLYESNETPASVKAAAIEALSRLNIPKVQGVGSSDLFYALAERFYYEEPSLAADVRYPTANIWYWNDQTGLGRKQVPHEIYHEIMTMRGCEYTLKLSGSRGDDALSLWLAANYKREAELPEGGTDETRPENYPPAHYWGVEAGTKYLNAALARAVKDRSAPVAFRSTRSLQEIVGQSNLFVGDQSKPLIDAMQFPDRKVRFEAAFALAAALPQTSFDGAQRVVPLLAEAFAQTGQPTVLLVMPSQDDLNKLSDELKKANGYLVSGSASAEGAVAASVALPAVDVIVVSEDIGPGNVDQLFNLANQNAKLAGAGRLVMTKTGASIYEPRKAFDRMLTTTTATDAAGLKPAIDEARAKAGALAMDSVVATDYATRAGNLMLKVGISKGQVYALAPAKQSLLSSLSDARPEIVKLAGQVLGLINDKEAQTGLLTTAADEKTADDVKISLYKSLATNAKFYGNMLDSSAIQSLEKTVADATNLDVRSAAAEARGALNLPADQAKSLIVNQSKI